MRRLVQVVLVVVACALVTGCFGGGGTTPINTDKAYVKVIVDWESLRGAQASAIREGLPPAVLTHVGARLVYHRENAAFSQSVARETAETQGIITLDVPPSDDASLFLVSAQSSPPGVRPYDNRIIEVAAMRHIRVAPGSVTTLRTSDFDWTTIDWRVIEPENWEPGITLYANVGEDVTLRIRYKDPFQPGEQPQFGDQILSMFTGGPKPPSVANSWDDAPDGYRTFTTVNSSEEAVNVYRCFGLFINSALFSLPAGQYHIDGMSPPYLNGGQWAGNLDCLYFIEWRPVD
ncbi:MAG: hypothetical protein ACM3X3_09900 [Betaproteobacteria bacterium]